MNKSRRVVVLDDDADTLDMMDRVLRLWSYEPVLFDVPQPALTWLSSAIPDVMAVLLDLVLPDMDGWQVYRRIREDARLAHLPVIVITALDPTFLNEPAPSPLTCFIRKPITLPFLHECLQRAEAEIGSA